MMKRPTKRELEEIRKSFSDDYKHRFQIGDHIIDRTTGRVGLIQDLTTYEGVWYSIHWIGSSEPDKIWNAYDLDKECEKL